MPGSMLQVSSTRPWFRWTLAEGFDGAHLEVCLDAECTRRELELDVTGERYRASDALPAGLHFWRVFARRGTSTDATPSPVWAFEVLDATRALALPEPIIDLNGDGARDTVTGGVLAFREWGISVRYGASTDGTHRADDELRGPMSAQENPLEVDRVTAVGMGDLDGDGLSDVLLSMPYRERQSEIQSSPVLRLTPLYGRRVGAPRLGRPLTYRADAYPGPYMASQIALGNAVELSGFIAGVGNYPICRATTELMSTKSAAPTHLTCDGGTLTAGDYNADGRVEMIEMWPPGFTREARAVPLCAQVPWLSEPRGRRETITRDVDLDGYDDLVLRNDETASYTVFGGPQGLDGTRCSATP